MTNSTCIARLIAPGDIIIDNKLEHIVTDVYYEGNVGSRLIIEADVPSGASVTFIGPATRRFTIKGH